MDSWETAAFEAIVGYVPSGNAFTSDTAVAVAAVAIGPPLYHPTGSGNSASTSVGGLKTV
jgi:hypothetical protein